MKRQKAGDSYAKKKRPGYTPTGRGSSGAMAKSAKSGALGVGPRGGYARRYGVLNQRTAGYLGMELKFVDYGYSAVLAAPADATGGEADPGTALALNSIAQGDGENQRDGRRATIKSAYVTGIVSFGASQDQPDPDSAPTVFIALVMDSQTNAAQLNSEDVFTNPGASALTAASPLRDLQYSQRFKVLDSVCIDNWFKYGQTDGVSTASYNGPSRAFKLSWTGDMITNFVGTTAVVGSIADYSLHVVAYCTTTENAPTLSYNSRVRFMG